MIADIPNFRNNLHNGVVSGAARGQALLGPMWAELTPDSKGDPTGDTEEPDRRRQETPHLSARRKGALPAPAGLQAARQVPGKKN